MSCLTLFKVAYTLQWVPTAVLGCKASSDVWCLYGVGEGVLKALDDVHHIMRHVGMGVYFNIIMQGFHLVMISSIRCMWL